MQARLFSKRCAYCGGPRTGKEALYLDGYEACRSCRTYFLEDPIPNDSPASGRIELSVAAVFV